jgi:hypothetical protein
VTAAGSKDMVAGSVAILAQAHCTLPLQAALCSVMVAALP